MGVKVREANLIHKICAIIYNGNYLLPLVQLWHHHHHHHHHRESHTTAAVFLDSFSL